MSASGHRLAAVIGFRAVQRPPVCTALHRRAARPDITCPILGLFGGAGRLIPVELVAEWDAVLDVGGVRLVIVTYDEHPDA
ncbi:MAG: hypothetical protein OXH13_00380 [Chloroflexi bacterium]|nr:hypothetical protein [Chloroflexota bacterium]MCY3695905.1 hypothetical protein [Chloroflexota bacterium]